nr:SLC13 family permease [Thetidibacter halocola]
MALCAILGVTVLLFVSGRLRHDLVAIAALLASVLAGLVPADRAFEGFGSTAVITVACVLILSNALQRSGAVDAFARAVLPADPGLVTMIAALTGIAALLSAFMNNVGALALLMPIALKAAARFDLPPSRLLMPLSFGSILGGMTTLIGTPPNLIVADYRREITGEAFGMFDFAPVGLAVAVAGLLFILLVGWRLVPVRKRSGTEGFDTGTYFSEVHVPEGAKAEGMTLREIEAAITETEIQVLGLVRRGILESAPPTGIRVRAGDILIVEAETEGFSAAVSTLGLVMQQPAADAAEGDTTLERFRDGEGHVELMEMVVGPKSPLVGRSPRGLRLRDRFRISLLAISRQDRRRIGRIGTARFMPGDVLLMQGNPDALAEFAADHDCLPLADRPLGFPSRRQMLTAAGIMLGTVALAASGLVAAPVAFALGVLLSALTGTVPVRRLYDAVDWPVIVLLGCLLPVANAMLDTGTADLLAGVLVGTLAGGAPVIALVLVLVVTMTLSDVMNNAATVAVMAPIALGIANTLGAPVDVFLMAVAIGGSCAFLTPIGHQNNTLILGPGGFRFADYWRLGLPLEVIVVAVATPMLLLVWG